LHKLSRVAQTDAEILITGPSGVGKELYARFVHQNSARRNAPFVPVNCGALPAELFENELFGHVNGAFTGAGPTNDGLVCAAEGGTLFLDEIHSLSCQCQIKLLRFLQEKEYRRLGDSRTQKADLRIVAATNANLEEEIKQHRFRDDLFFRLRVFPVSVLPLSRRRADILPLLTEFVQHYADEYDLPPIGFTDDALDRLMAYGWPGNIRELENMVRYLTCLQLDRPVTTSDLPLLQQVEDAPSSIPIPDDLLGRPMKEAKCELITVFERRYLEKVLAEVEGNITHAAKRSGKPRRAFFELLRKYEINAQDFRQTSTALPILENS
jgi:DNA-binding NtrC family response regulator